MTDISAIIVAVVDDPRRITFNDAQSHITANKAHPRQATKT
jgi:hypothetical protein